jgi:hypothetical protein
VPIAIFTPAATALAKDAWWASMTSCALATTLGGSCAPFLTASSTECGATSVGTSQVPAASIMSMASSSRQIRPPCSGQLAVLPGQGHDINPDATARAMAEFLAS